MTLPVLAARQTPRTSNDYVAEILKRRGSNPDAPALTKDAKQRKLALVLSDETHGIRRLGVGMVGPIQLKLRYQGMTRNVLVEDPITPGTPIEYEVWDDTGQAYTLNSTDGEVRITPFEGKRVRVETGRIASYPAIRYDDLIHLRLNAVEQAQDETKQAILKEEDSRLMKLLEVSVTGYANRADHDITPDHRVTETSGYFTPQALYSAVSLVDPHEIESSRILMSVYDYRDLYRWTINETGWAFKDRVVAGEKITSFGEFSIQRSVMVPPGDMFLLPEPDFLGVFPVLYDLKVEENHKVGAFWKGWVFHEQVGMAVLNPRGIARVRKV